MLILYINKTYCIFTIRLYKLHFPAAMGHACAALSALLAGISEIHRKDYPQVEQTLSGKVLHVSSMTCFQLTPQYILLGVAEAFVTPACTYSQFTF